MKKITNESLGAVHTHTHTWSLKENKKKNIKGITLVALVVTIIILLILAGISISALTQTGLFGKAKQAEQKSKDAQELENLTLADYENKIDSSVSGSRDADNKYNLTLIWNTEISEGSVTFLNGHTYDEFDAIRFIYSSYVKNTRYMEKECSKELWKIAMESSLNTTAPVIGLYGYRDLFIDIYCVSNSGFKIKNTNYEWIYRIYGVNY